MMSGHVISASGPEYVGEKIGRAREERVKRKRDEKKTDEILNRLLVMNGGGRDTNAAAGTVRKAREVMKSMKSLRCKEPQGEDKPRKSRKSAYSAETIKRLGFDPATKGGQEGNAGDMALKRKVGPERNLHFFCSPWLPSSTLLRHCNRIVARLLSVPALVNESDPVFPSPAPLLP